MKAGEAGESAPLSRLGVFCGSSLGRRREYAQAAEALGALLARRGNTLVYGGGSVGLMGVLARSVLAAGGKVIGVIPQHLQERVERLPPGARVGLAAARLEVVPDMHARKRRMYELADGFLVLPGGIGTVEEFFEAYTWCQLGLHLKPIGLLDTAGYFQPLLVFLDAMVEQGFLSAAHRASLLVDARPEELLEALGRYRPVYVDKLEPEG
jgi:uncharacterized protein (TIGR00730 family)